MRVLIIYFISIVVVGADAASFKKALPPWSRKYSMYSDRAIKGGCHKGTNGFEICPNGRPNCGNREEIKVIPDPDGKTYKERCCPTYVCGDKATKLKDETGEIDFKMHYNGRYPFAVKGDEVHFFKHNYKYQDTDHSYHSSDEKSILTFREKPNGEGQVTEEFTKANGEKLQSNGSFRKEAPKTYRL